MGDQTSNGRADRFELRSVERVVDAVACSTARLAIRRDDLEELGRAGHRQQRGKPEVERRFPGGGNLQRRDDGVAYELLNQWVAVANTVRCEGDDTRLGQTVDACVPRAHSDLRCQTAIHVRQDRLDLRPLFDDDGRGRGQSDAVRLGPARDLDAVRFVAGRNHVVEHQLGHQQPREAGVQLAAHADYVPPRLRIDRYERELFGEGHTRTISPPPGSARPSELVWRDSGTAGPDVSPVQPRRGRCEHRWYGCRARPGSGVDHLQANALVTFALALGLHDADAADLAGGVHVRAAISLLVETDDVDHPNLRHGLRDHRDLRADEILVHHRRRSGQERHFDLPVGGQFVVDELLDARPEPLRQRVELEVHAGAERFHVP